MPNVSIPSSGAGATASAVCTDGVITSIAVTNGGNNYAAAPGVSIVGGGGLNATAHSVLTGGAVTSIVVDNGGTNYGLNTSEIAAYAGTIIAPQNATELSGIARLSARGSGGNETILIAQGYVSKVISGGYLDGSYAVPIINNIQTKGASAFLSVQSLIGRNAFVNDLSVPLAQSLTAQTSAIYNARLSAQLLNADYQAERALMDNGMGYGIDLGKQSVVDAETLRRAGLNDREYRQSTYELLHKIFIEQEELAVVGLDVFGNAIRAITGSQQTTTENYSKGSPVVRVVGGVVAGAVAGAIAGSVIPGIGTVIGGVIGAVLGGVSGAFG